MKLSHILHGLFAGFRRSWRNFNNLLDDRLFIRFDGIKTYSRKRVPVRPWFEELEPIIVPSTLLSVNFDSTASSLGGWTPFQTGGSAYNQGTVTHDSSGFLLDAGDSLTLGMKRNYVVPDSATRLSFAYNDLTLDANTSPGINDAFEAAFVDSKGKPLAYTIGTNRDAFFNITAGLGAVLGQTTTTQAQSSDDLVSLDLSGVAPGTTGTVMFRLIHNDPNDHPEVRILSNSASISGAASVNEGTPYKLLLAAQTDVPTTKWVINWGDDSGDHSYTDTNNSTVMGSPSAVTHTFPGSVQTETIHAWVVGSDSSYVEANALTVAIDNVAPVATITAGPLAVNSTDVVTYSGTFTDPGGSADLNYKDYWLAVSNTTGAVIASQNDVITSYSGTSGVVPDFSFVPPAIGTYTVTLQVSDFASDIYTLNVPNSGTVTLAYDGSQASTTGLNFVHGATSAAALESYFTSIPALNTDTVAFTSGGTVTFSYNGSVASSPSFTFSSSTTSLILQNYLATIPGLTSAGAVKVTGSNGGPYNVIFAAPTNGSLLTVTPGTTGATVTFAPSVPPVVITDHVTFTGASTVTFSYNGSVASSPNFAYTSSTSAVDLQNYLATIPGLTGTNAVDVSGPNGGPFAVAINTSGADHQLTVTPGTAATISSSPGLNVDTLTLNSSGTISFKYNGAQATTTTFAYTSSTTAASLQTYLSSIPGLTGSGTINVSGPNGGPFGLALGDNTSAYLLTASFTSGGASLNYPRALNVDNVTYTTAGTATFTYNGALASTPGFSLSSSTTAAAFQTYLASIPGLDATGAVGVSGSNGGPFAVTINTAGGASLLSVIPNSTGAAIGYAVSVTGDNGGPFNVAFNSGTFGNLASSVSAGTSATLVANSAVATRTLTVGARGLGPVVSLGYSFEVVANQVQVDLNGLFKDVDGNTIDSYSVRWGDGTPDQPYTFNATFNAHGEGFGGLPPDPVNTPTHVYARGGIYPVWVFIGNTSGIAAVSVPVAVADIQLGPVVDTPKVAGIATHFIISAPTSTLTGSPIEFTVKALDSFGNVATAFGGAVHFSSTDTQALFPLNDVTLTSGMGTFVAILKTAASQGTIMATSHLASGATVAGVSGNITASALQVTSFTPTPTGFSATFNKAFLPNDLFLYDTNTSTAADVTVSYNGGLNKITGTLILDPTNTSITFKGTATNLIQMNQLKTSDSSYESQVLPDATYTVTFVSGTSGKGFFDALGNALDGASNYGHANFVTTFTTHYQSNATPALGITDFARGPDTLSAGNTVNGNSTIEVPNFNGTGVPIILYNKANVTDVTFSLSYNPLLLTGIHAFGGTGSDATDQSSSLTLTSITSVSATKSLANFHYSDSTAITANADNPLVLGDFDAYVPSEKSAITSITESNNTVTVTLASTVSDSFSPTVGHTVAIDGVTNSGYDGIFTITSVSGSTFQYADSAAFDLSSSSGGFAGVTALGLYGSMDLLQFSNIHLNGTLSTTAVSASGIHLNVYAADVNGDGIINSQDTTVANTVAGGAARGFGVFPRIDPVVIADVVGDLSVDVGDAITIDNYVQGYQPSQIPVPATQNTTNVVTFAGSDSITFAYNGTSGSAFTYNSSITAADFTTYLDTLSVLNGDTIVFGGDGNIKFAYNGINAANALAYSFDGAPTDTTSSDIQTYLSTITGLNQDTVRFTGAGSATFTFNGSHATPAGFSYTSSTTASQLQTYLATLPGLSGNVTVTGSAGGPFNVTITAAAGANLLAVGSAGTTGATVQPSIMVTGTPGGPFHVAFASGLTGNDQLTIASDDTGACAVYNDTVSVSGSTGGPFTLTYAPRIISGTALTIAAETTTAHIQYLVLNQSAVALGSAKDPGTPSLTNPLSQSSAQGDQVRVPLVATDSAGNGVTYSATGLPSFLSLNAATGMISGIIPAGATPTSYSVTATATDNLSGNTTSTTFSWIITKTDTIGGVAGTPAYFTVSSPAMTITGAPMNFTVEALDTFGNVVPYSGSVTISSSDPSAVFPSTSVSFASGSGIGTFMGTLKTSGTQTIIATGTVSGTTIAGISNDIVTSGLTVTSFIPTTTGFTVVFNKPFVPTDVTIAGPSSTIDDVTLVGTNGVGSVHGSILIDPSDQSLTFVADSNYLTVSGSHDNDAPTVLADAAYTVTLKSGTSSNGFLDALGAHLDGQDNFGHADYVTYFTTRYQQTGTPILGIPNFSRGPNGSGDTTTLIKVPNDNGKGIPVTLYNAVSVTDVTFSLTYNSTIFTVSSALAGSSSDANDSGASLALVSNSGGVATFHYTNSTAKSATTSSPLILGDILAYVPNSASSHYKADQLVKLSNIVINGQGSNVTGALTAFTIQVNTFFGDVNADGVIDGLDKLAVNTVAGASATGFSAYPLLDPIVIGDVSSNNTVDSSDVTIIDNYVAVLSPSQIPSVPTGLTLTSTSPAAADVLLLGNPGTLTNSPLDAVSLQLAATNSAGNTLSYSVGGLPDGLSYNTSTGAISGTISGAAQGNYHVTATVTESKTVSGSTVVLNKVSQSFTWTVGGPTTSPTATVPVVIFSSPGSTTLGTLGFNALEVNTASLRFGPAGISATTGQAIPWEAVPLDGTTDDLATFNLQKSGLLAAYAAAVTAGTSANGVTALLTGTIDGYPFEGVATYGATPTTEKLEQLTNKSSEAGTKFFVVDASTDPSTGAPIDQIYRYGADGTAQGSLSIAGLTTPTGVASSATGDKIWILDATSGAKITRVNTGTNAVDATWTVTNSSSTNLAHPAGIALSGNDLWVLDAGSGSGGSVYKYTGAKTQGTTTAVASSTSFSLTTADAHPTDITTNGTYIWVTDLGDPTLTTPQPPMVFRYNMSGTSHISWQLDIDNADPTGITLDPAGGDDLWVVDGATHMVYLYTHGQIFGDSEYHGYTNAFPLIGADQNPQGIADPLTLLASAAGSVFPTATPVLITGQATLNGTGNALVAGVTINGSAVATVDAAGDFFQQVSLGSNANTFTIDATDMSGTAATETTLTLTGIPAASAGPVDFSQLIDLTAAITPVYGRTSWNQGTFTLYADLGVTDSAAFSIDAPLYVAVDHISDPSVALTGSAGVTPDGAPYFDISGLIPPSAGATQAVLAAGESSVTGQSIPRWLSLGFFDPTGVAFTYDLVFLGRVHQAPRFTSVPVVSTAAGSGKSYNYQPVVANPDGLPLTYSLVTGPSGLTINANTGALAWPNPTAGNQIVSLQLSDVFGGSETQTFVLSAVSSNNRPPQIQTISLPVAYVNTPYSYGILATDADQDSLTFSLTSSVGTNLPTMAATTGSAGAYTGTLRWTPSPDQIGTRTITVYVTDDASSYDTDSGHYDKRVYQIDVEQAPVTLKTGTLEGVASFTSGSEIVPSGTTTATAVYDGSTFLGDSLVNKVNDVARADLDLGNGGLYNYHNDVNNFTPTDIVSPYLRFADESWRNLLDSAVSDPGYDPGNTDPGGVFGVPSILTGTNTVESVAPGTTGDPDLGTKGNHGISVTADTELIGTVAQTTFKFASASGHSLDGTTFIVEIDSLGYPPGHAEPDIHLTFSGSLAGNNLELYGYSHPFTVSLDGAGQSNAKLVMFGVGGGGDFVGSILATGDLTQPLLAPDTHEPIPVSEATSGFFTTDGWTDPIESVPGHIGMALAFSLSGTSASLVIHYDGMAKNVDMPMDSTVDLKHKASDGSLTTVATTITDSQGHYSFSGLAPGNYVVTEVPDLGWQVSNPSTNSYSVALAGGQDIAGLDFENVLDLGNEPPVLSQPSDSTVAAGTLTALTFSASATDDHTSFGHLTYAFVGTPPEHATLSSSGSFSFQPTTQQGPHTYTFTIRVTDDGANALTFGAPLSDTKSFTVTVTGGDLARNRAPYFPGLSGSTVHAWAVVGRPWNYTATASDPDGDKLTYSLPVHPDGMSVDPVTGIMSWIPFTDPYTDVNATLLVSDGLGGLATQQFTITVGQAGANGIAITSKAPPYAVDSTTYTYQVVASQLKTFHALTYSLLEQPAGMTIDASSGLITWVLDSGVPQQTFAVAVEVSDEVSESNVQNFTVDVLASYPSPTTPFAITSLPRDTIAPGSKYVYVVQSNDPYDDRIGYAVTPITGKAFPTGMSFYLPPESDTYRNPLTWTPTEADVGQEYWAEITAVASDGETDTQVLDLKVTDQLINGPPVITSALPNASLIAGNEFTTRVTGTDPDNDPIHWSLVAPEPPGMEIDSATGNVDWQPIADEAGTYTVTVQATDTFGAYSRKSFSMSILATDPAPQILSTPLTKIGDGQTYQYQVIAVDPEGNALEYLVSGAGGDSAISDSGLMTWHVYSGYTPGDVPVTIQVFNSHGVSQKQFFNITVGSSAVLLNPSIVPPLPPLMAEVDVAYDATINANDPNGDLISSFTVTGLPSGMMYAPVSGHTYSLRIYGTPTSTFTGNITITVTDTDSKSTTETLPFKVVGTQTPVLNTIGDQAVTAGNVFHYAAHASDGNKDAFTYSLTGSPPTGMAIDNNGNITWATAAANIGSHTITVKATNIPFGNYTTEPFDLTVAADGQAPKLRLAIEGDNPLVLGGSETFDVLATDNVGVDPKSLTVEVTSLTSMSFTPIYLPVLHGQAFWTDATPAGRYTVTVTGKDAANNTGTATVTLTVFDPSATGSPAVTITSPSTDGATITSPTDILGSVTETGVTVTYTVSVIPFGGGAPILIGQGGSVSNGVLAHFDPTVLANGSYTIEVAAYANGNSTVIDRQIEVSGELKPGAMNVSFTDLTIPVAGIPITITRSYNSLDAGTQGDFGYGWTLGIGDPKLQVNLPADAGEGWGNYPAFTDGTRVYLTLPDGSRQGFTFAPIEQADDPDPNNPMAGLLTHWIPAFRSDPGNTATLSVPNATDDMMDVENMQYTVTSDDGELTSYNPQNPLFGNQYVLTMPGGINYNINATTGHYISISNRAGTALYIDADGITSSLGAQVIFRRDPEGRISQIIDPSGHSLKYSYDPAGNLVSVTDRLGNVTRMTYFPSRTDSTQMSHNLDSIIDPLNRPAVQTQYYSDGRVEQMIDAAGRTVTYTYNSKDTAITFTSGSGTVVLAYNGAQNNSPTFAYTTSTTAATLQSYLASLPGVGAVTVVGNAGGPFHAYFDSGFDYTKLTVVGGPIKVDTYADTVTDVPGTFKLAYNGTNASTTFTFSTSTTASAFQTYLATLSGIVDVTVFGNEGGPFSVYFGPGFVPSELTVATGSFSLTTGAATAAQVQIDQVGRATTTVQDLLGNVLEQVSPNGVVTLKQYNDSSLPNTATEEITVVGKIDALTTGETNDLTTTYSYDNQGNLLSTTDPSGNVALTLYDINSNPISEIDALGNVTSNYFDPNTGQPDEVSKPNGQVTSFGYNGDGNLTEVDNAKVPAPAPGDPNNGEQLISDSYDSAGNVTQSISAAGPATSYAYDADGNEIASWYLDATSNVYVVDLTFYDPSDQTTGTEQAVVPQDHFDITKPTVFGSQYISWTTSTTYDGDGKVLNTTSETGLRTQNTYDDRGELIETRQQSQDASADLNATNGSNDVPDVWLVTRTVYDDAGQAIATTHQYVDGTSQPIFGTLTSYDGDGNVVETDQVKGIEIDLDLIGGSYRSVLVSSGTTVAYTASQYDSADREISSVTYNHSKDDTSDGGLETQTYYDVNGNVIRTRREGIDQTGSEVWLVSDTVYDGFGHVMLTTDPYSVPSGTLITDNGSAAFATKTVYDSLGREIESIRLSGVQVNIVNDASVLASTPTQLSMTQTSYDGNGRVTETVAADGEVTDIEYDNLGRQVAEIGTPVLLSCVGLTLSDLTLTDAPDLSGDTDLKVRLRTKTTYDPATGQMATQISNIREVDYSGNAYLDTTAAHTTSYQYDAQGNLIKTIYADGTSTTAAYDNPGNKTSQTDQLGQTTGYQYDLEGRLIQVTLPAPASGQSQPVYIYAYDALGNQVLIRDPLGHETWFTYDGQGHELTRTLPMGYGSDGKLTPGDSSTTEAYWTEKFLYDDQGRVTQHVSFEGVTTKYAYDAVTGQMTQQKFYQGSTLEETWTFTFDGFGREYRAVQSGGVNEGTTTYGYDGQGNVTQITSPQGTVSYEYDAFNRKTATIDGTTGSPNRAIEYQYDDLGRLKSIDDNQDPGASPAEALATTYKYDLLGRLIEETITAAGATDKIIDDYTYDSMNRLLTLVEYANDSYHKVAEYDYGTPNANGTNSSLEETFYESDGSTPLITNSVAWGYDHLDRLTQETMSSTESGLGYSDTYAYDQAGNRSTYTHHITGSGTETVTYSYDVNDQLTQSVSTTLGTSTYQYNHTQQTLAVEPQTSGDTQSSAYSYDWQGNMKSATVTKKSAGGSVLSQEILTYGYDATGIRVSALDKLDSNGDGTLDSQTLTTYLNDAQNFTGYSQVLQETQNNVATSPATTTEVIKYTWGLNGVAQTAHLTGGSTTTLVFGHDGHGSVRDLTDPTLTVQQIYIYNAFGQMIGVYGKSGGSTSNSWNIGTGVTSVIIMTGYLYSNQQTDRQTGLQYLRARYYNPGTATFNQLDPYFGDPQNPQTFNKYLYVHGDSINYADPTGRDFSLAEIQVNIETGIRLGASTLNAINRVYQLVGTIENIIGMFSFISNMYTFVSQIAIAMSGGASFGPAFGSALNQAFGVNVPTFGQFTSGINSAFSYIGSRWADLRDRIVRNAGRMAADVGTSKALNAIIKAQQRKSAPITLLIDLPSPPKNVPWTTIAIPIITLPGGFRIKIQSDGRPGRLFGIGAIIAGKSQSHTISIIHVDYEDYTGGVAAYKPHYNLYADKQHYWI